VLAIQISCLLRCRVIEGAASAQARGRLLMNVVVSGGEVDVEEVVIEVVLVV